MVKDLLVRLFPDKFNSFKLIFYNFSVRILIPLSVIKL